MAKPTRDYTDEDLVTCLRRDFQMRGSPKGLESQSRRQKTTKPD